MKATFIRIGDSVFTLQNLNRVFLDLKNHSVGLVVEGESQPFIFEHKSKEEGNAMYLNLIQVLQRNSVENDGFLFIVNVGVKIRLLSALYVNDKVVRLILKDGAYDEFTYDTAELATKNFEQLTSALGIGSAPVATGVAKPAKPVKAQKKSPTKPAKGGKSRKR